ncbi:triose-phosphate isomerase [Pikeienuella sp. HZG-20]|uniref:triose-phosphate isomerase n=1 Tax=Paludibacillus litoralis TaxID=3133267 RepID=UPI0030EB7947
MGRRALIVGNWKMNGLAGAQAEIEAIAANAPAGPDLLICPPATLISRLAGRGVAIGGQDCHEAASGAHTGDISAEMLADAGAVAVILGHSERRADHGETDEIVRKKVLAAWRGGLAAIICVGETAAERDAGDALAVILRQMADAIPPGAAAASTVIAYEPVWAIGTGRTPDAAEIEEAHSAIRAELTRRFGDEGAAMRILYGGSMNPRNAGTILGVPDVDGGLVGGASLAAADFLEIAAQAARRMSP